MVGNSAHFKLAAQPDITFGTGTISSIGELALCLGKSALLVTGKQSWYNSGLKVKVEKYIQAAGIKWEHYIISGEPSPAHIDDAVSGFRAFNPDMVVAIGGGSVLDAGKAISAMLCEEGSVRHYLEGVGDRQPSGQRKGLIAVPTTAGTGSETTKNAVISEFGKKGFKKSLRHDNYVPDYALIDPELTLSCSRLQTCTSGMDAFSQLLESYISTAANEYTDALALSGLQAVSRSLHKVFMEPENLGARTDMSYAAMLSGICLANAGLGVVHGFAQPLGSLFPVPHGIVCGSLMGPVNRMTLAKAVKQNGVDPVTKKFARAGRFFTEDCSLTEFEYAEILVHEIEYLTREFRIPSFSEYQISPADIPAIVSQTGLKNHPVTFSADELGQIFAARL
ncbi:MAG: iron-containing alcohol dehydrogenase [Bacteroidales bacterium]|nr:iron-containing alcohol dehydrogenase [Bacteroidales bacterium]